jgi:N-acetylglucosamine-6-phosphate deacetylase
MPKSMLYIHDATLLDPQVDAPPQSVLIEGDEIVAVGAADDVPCPPDADQIDAAGLSLSPGFIDLQLNGAFGLDFTAAPATIWEVGRKLTRYGVTTFLPTIITSSPETVAAAQKVLQAGPPPGYLGAAALGLHLEGPFLNPVKCGAHEAALMRAPSLNDVTDWWPDKGVRLVTLAPELPGALEVTRALCERGVLVSAGHSLADYDQARAGLLAGVGYGTHVFNAMPTLEHRAPGLAGALLTDRQAIVGVIADGVHLHPAVVELIWRIKGLEHVNLVSDAMAALGMPPGRYQLGSFEVLVDRDSARLNDGRLAGSVLSLDQAVRNLIAYTGCTPPEAVATVTRVPARALHLRDRGRIRVGMQADLTLLTGELRVAATIVGGQVAWRVPGEN